MLAAKVSVTAINEARNADGVEEKIDTADDDQPQLLSEAKSAMKDVAVKQTSMLSVEERMAMLKVDQRRVFDNIKAHLLHQEQHDSKVLQLSLHTTVDVCEWRRWHWEVFSH